MPSWGDFVNRVVEAHTTARQQQLDGVLLEPFDTIAHSTAIRVGTRVGYAKQFLRLLRCPATDLLWRLKGTVTALKPLGDSTLVVVKWQVSSWRDYPAKVNVANLAPVGPNLHYCGD